MTLGQPDATEEEAFWGARRLLDEQGRPSGFAAVVVPRRLPTWVPAWFHSGPGSLIGVLWTGLVWGPPWRVLVMRQHRRRLIVRTARCTAGVYDDLAAANTAARQIDAPVSYTHLTLPTNREV